MYSVAVRADARRVTVPQVTTNSLKKRDHMTHDRTQILRAARKRKASYRASLETDMDKAIV